jgi:tetratricopeptide (TPR) repeat protein
MNSSPAPCSGGFFRAGSFRYGFLLFAIAGLHLAPVALAHGDLDVQIRLVSEEIARAPSAALYLKRGVLHHQHEDYVRALDDYDRAEELVPASAKIGFARSRTLFQSGQFTAARASLDRFLAQAPAHAEAFLLRARVLACLKEHAAAVRDFDRYLGLALEPLPDCYLERAAGLVASGDRHAGLSSLDEGIRRLGNLVTLQNAAIALELELKRPDAALARVDRIMTGLERTESWLARRGEILETAGRADEARRAYRGALSAIERLPLRHRDTKSMHELQDRLRLKLGS